LGLAAGAGDYLDYPRRHCLELVRPVYHGLRDLLRVDLVSSRGPGGSPWFLAAPLGRGFSASVKRDSFRGGGGLNDRQPGGQRPHLDATAGHVLYGGGLVSDQRRSGNALPQVGLATLKRHCHPAAGYFDLGAMAALGTLGDRFVCRRRPDIQRLGQRDALPGSAPGGASGRLKGGPPAPVAPPRRI